jgi:hypothetical protein
MQNKSVVVQTEEQAPRAAIADHEACTSCAIMMTTTIPTPERHSCPKCCYTVPSANAMARHVKSCSHDALAAAAAAAADVPAAAPPWMPLVLTRQTRPAEVFEPDEVEVPAELLLQGVTRGLEGYLTLFGYCCYPPDAPGWVCKRVKGLSGPTMMRRESADADDEWCMEYELADVVKATKRRLMGALVRVVCAEHAAGRMDAESVKSWWREVAAPQEWERPGEFSFVNTGDRLLEYKEMHTLLIKVLDLGRQRAPR